VLRTVVGSICGGMISSRNPC